MNKEMYQMSVLSVCLIAECKILSVECNYSLMLVMFSG